MRMNTPEEVLSAYITPTLQTRDDSKGWSFGKGQHVANRERSLATPWTNTRLNP